MKKISPAVISLTIGIFLVSFIFLIRDFSPLRIFELKTLDYRFQIRGPHTGLLGNEDRTANNLDVVLVDLDDESWRLIPSDWPYPRDLWANVIQNLSRAGAKVIVFDIIFDKPGGGTGTGDSLFAKAIQEANQNEISVILAGKKVSEPTRIPPVYIQKPISRLIRAGASVGLTNELQDIDGFTRRYILFDKMPGKEKRYWSLGMQTVLKYKNLTNDSLNLQSENKEIFENLSVNTFMHPQLTLINYYGPPSGSGPEPPTGPWKTFNRYPLSNVLDDASLMLQDPMEDTNWMELFYSDGMLAEFGMVEESPFKDKIVIIGTSLSEFHDLKETPYFTFAGFQHLMPGFEIHANAIQMILDRNYIRTGNIFLVYVLTAIAVIIITVVLARTGPLFSGLLTLLLGYAFVEFSFGAFWGDYFWSLPGLFNILFGNTGGIRSALLPLTINLNVGLGEAVYYPVVAPIVSLLTAYGMNGVYRFIQEQKEKRWIQNAFGHFLNPEVVREITEHPEKLRLGGERRYLTVLFSDIENFTTMSENMPPDQLAEFLNEYLTALTHCITENDGMIDKYEGDAIMAEFGAPIPSDDHAVQASAAAVTMQKRLEQLRVRWRLNGLPEMKTRIGINTGEMALGNFGSDNVFDYTVMGDAVNIGARLESANKEYGTDIMISDETNTVINLDFVTRPLDKIIVKGKTQPLMVHELIGHNGDPEIRAIGRDEILSIYLSGIQCYFNRNWQEGISKFNQVLERVPDDKPSNILRDRCEHYLKKEPPEDWDGVFFVESK